MYIVYLGNKSYPESMFCDISFQHKDIFYRVRPELSDKVPIIIV